MNPAEIIGIIEREVAGDWSRSNAHGVDLKKCLIPPVKRMYEDSFKTGEMIELWLVLEEIPADRSGYKIVFDEQTRRFGLATAGTERDVFLGYYGSFLNTLEGM